MHKIGEFHEDILSSVPGWEKLKQGIDIQNLEQKIIAEIKNKYNTVKGSDKVGIYDYLETMLNQPQYEGFTAYYVEIIPKTPKGYDRDFTPSDRKLGIRRPANPQIRQISGQKFYHIATGYENALSMLFEVLPDVISKISGQNTLSEAKKTSFQELFTKAFEG